MGKHKANLEVDRQILDFADKVTEFKKSIPGKAVGKYPSEIQKQAIALYKKSGLSMSRFGESTGLSGVSISYWIKQRQSVPFREVEILETKSEVIKNQKGYTIELANGAKIHGLQIEDVQKLIGLQ
jgi:hypothetical protein